MVGVFFESDCHHDGVRRVIILSIETHPDMMSLSIVYWTGYSWACLGALGRCAALPPAPRAVSRPRPHPGRARAPSHVTPDASASHRTPTGPRPRQHGTVHRVTRTHTISHHKVPHRCPRPGLVKAERVPTLRVCIYQPSVKSTCPRPLPSHTALHESHCG
jgi:hypothetical protein